VYSVANLRQKITTLHSLHVSCCCSSDFLVESSSSSSSGAVLGRLRPRSHRRRPPGTRGDPPRATPASSRSVVALMIGRVTRQRLRPAQQTQQSPQQMYL